jgi:peptide/nickel transport system substrate-binding protein
MNYSKRGLGRIALYASVIGAMVVSILPAASTGAYAQGNTRKINNFDVAGRFLEEWNKPGSEQNSVYVNGLPITARRPEISTEDGKSYDTQWFERAKFEAHPENRAPYDVLFGRLGANLAAGRGSIDPATNRVRNPADAPFVKVDRPADISATKVWFPETGHTVSGKILEYWNRYGGVAQFGFPLSEPFKEISPTDGKTYDVQYFERNRFELHPEKAAPYEVELGLLGVQQFKTTPVAANDIPIAPPTGVTSSRDTLVQGSLQEPSTLVGMEENTVVLQRIIWAVTFQDALVGLDDKEVLFPLAAWYVPTLENGGSYFTGAGDDRHMVTKFKLRQGIKWADGREITSNDAIFSYGLFINNPQAASRSIQIKVANIENPDKYTIIYNWMSLNQAKAKQVEKRGDSEFAFLQTFIDAKKPVIDQNYVFVGSVHPRHIMQNLPVDKLQQSSYAQNPIGYGPFKVTEWKVGDQMILEQNENYNLTAKPLFRRIVVRFQTDVNANINAMLTGNIDAIASEGLVVAPEQTPQIRAAGHVVDTIPALSWEHLDFYFGFEPFKDKAVREAMIRGINRQQVVDVVFGGAGAVMDTVVPPTAYHSLQNADYATNFPDLAAKYKLPTYPFDRAAATKLLQDAGWVPGADGIRAKGGVKLEFEYGTTRSAVRQAAQQLVINDLKAIGINAVQAIYPTGFFDNDGPIATGQTKLAQFAYVQLTTSNFDSWDSSQIPTPDAPGLGNRQQYRNATVDAANRAYSSEVDRNIIAEQSAIAQVALATDIALIPLVQRANIEIYSGKLKNRKTTNSSAPQWWNITQWYLVP